MKRYGNLYGSICSFENLWRAAREARRGKRKRPDVLHFWHELEGRLVHLRDELAEQSYTPGAYRSFYIHDPKKRLISAAPFRDRIVHHALCRVIEPLFERGFIHASYANRPGKGTHTALDHCTLALRRYRYVLKCDIEKYFPSIDHALLFERIARKIKCRDTLALIERIIAASNAQEYVVHYFPGDDLFTPHERRIGIPIGNLTSQFFANIYLDGFDHYVTEQLGGHAYIRFMDDFLLFSDSTRELREALAAMDAYLAKLRLALHPRKCQIYAARSGVPFLGWLVFPDHRRLRRKTGVRFQRRLRALQEEYAHGERELKDVKASIMSWLGHLKHGDARGLSRKLLWQTSFRRAYPGEP